MSIVSDAKMYARFALGLNRFLRTRITLEGAKAVLRRRLQERESNFLRVVERGIYGYARSPYLPLLKLAGCEFGDIRDMVREKGLEATLLALRRAGVYVSFEEFKGHQPIERHGKVFRVRPRDFDNPFSKQCYVSESGGSTGAGTRTPHDLDNIISRAPVRMLAKEAKGILNLPTALWRGILPNAVGVNIILGSALTGNVPQKWFTPITSRDRKTPLKFRLANFYIIHVGRLHGIPVPSPEHVTLEDAGVVSAWAADTVRRHGGCHVNTSAGMAVRISLAAQERGLDLTGTIITGAGEPPTPAKVRAIETSGARHMANYHCSGVGAIGYNCVNPIDCNDQHFVKDHLAMIQYPRKVPNTDIEVEAFNLTSLSPTATMLLLNVEIDDYGIVEKRSCGCPLEEYGFTEHIRHIRSFRKLTGEGITLIGSDMEHIIDEVLPARFGGSPIHYQLIEEEDDRGITRLSLIVSPQVQIDDEEAVIDTVLKHLGKKAGLADGARAIWAQARSLRVKRMEPIWTARGKLMPLHLARKSRSAAKRPPVSTRTS